MVGLERQQGFQIVLPDCQRFARHAENQIDRNRADVPPGDCHRRRQLLGRMISLQQAQLGRVERLPAQADPSDAQLGQLGQRSSVTSAGLASMLSS